MKNNSFKKVISSRLKEESALNTMPNTGYTLNRSDPSCNGHKYPQDRSGTNCIISILEITI
ncbi:MAG: hypothetical protein Q8N05_20655 [Bacteroidota bacterium]|nr:hypothetical protein [Bacteroidota bacterium]